MNFGKGKYVVKLQKEGRNAGGGGAKIGDLERKTD